jgi:hypothetical protein
VGTGLIILGVVVFLVIDSFILYRFMYKRHKTAGDFAKIAVPGEATVTLPAGKVKLTYQESQKSSSAEHEIYFEVPDVLKVEVTGGSSGEALPIKGVGLAGTGESKSTGPGFSRSVIGTVQVTEPGVYTVTAGPTLDAGAEPTVLVGK